MCGKRQLFPSKNIKIYRVFIFADTSVSDVHSVKAKCKWGAIAIQARKPHHALRSYCAHRLNKMVPDYLSNKLTPTNVIHSHNLRPSDSKLFVPRPLTESLKKSFIYRGTVLWYSLPVEAVNASSVLISKILLDKPNFLLLFFSIVILSQRNCNLYIIVLCRYF
jgi:hypothetical protein